MIFFHDGWGKFVVGRQFYSNVLLSVLFSSPVIGWRVLHSPCSLPAVAVAFCYSSSLIRRFKRYRNGYEATCGKEHLLHVDHIADVGNMVFNYFVRVARFDLQYKVGVYRRLVLIVPLLCQFTTLEISHFNQSGFSPAATCGTPLYR